MHITKVVLKGFKSFKEKTIVQFLPGLNVIVGHNGAGKSNIIYAIQFVLAHEFQHLSQQKLADMLYVSSAGGPAVSCGYVEIIFDNNDRQLPEEGDEVRLRRSITKSKDCYTLNGHSMTRDQVERTLQSAGLSKVNPYYVIGQGKVRELATASNEKRLDMLSQIAGSLLWTNEIKPEDDNLLKDIKGQITQLRHFILETEDTINVLQREEAEFMKFEENEKSRRAIQYLLLKKDLSRVVSKLETANGNLSNQTAQIHSTAKELSKAEEAVAVERGKAEEIQCKLHTTVSQLNSSEESYLLLVSECNQLELDLEDIRSHQRGAGKHSSEVNETLRQVRQTIESKETVMEQISAEIEQSDLELVRFHSNLSMREQRRKYLNTKAGRNSQFASPEERNQWINAEIAALNLVVLNEEELIRSMNEEIARSKELLTEELGREEELRKEEQIAKNSLGNDQQSKRNLEEELRAARTLRHDKWREMHEIDEGLKFSSAEVEKTKSVIARVASNDVVAGFLAIQMIVSEMFLEGGHAASLAQQYRGLVVEQFKCPEEMLIVAESVAKNRLFYHVVDTDEAAAEILGRLNAKGWYGTANFYPINRLQQKGRVVLREESKNDALNLIDKLGPIEEGMEIVVEQLFGRVLLCRNLPSAFFVSRLNSGALCATLEGDVVRSGGTASGGYFEKTQSRFKLYEKFSKALADEEAKRSELGRVKKEIETLEEDINKKVNELQRMENKIFQSRVSPIQTSLQTIRESIDLTRQLIEENESRVRRMEASVLANRGAIETLRAENQQDAFDGLNPLELDELALLKEEIRGLDKSIATQSDTHHNLVANKMALKSELDNLRKKEKDLKQFLLEHCVGGSNALLQDVDKLKETIENRKTDLRSREARNARLQQEKDRYSAEVRGIQNLVEELEGIHAGLQGTHSSLLEGINRLRDSIKNLEERKAQLKTQLKEYDAFAMDTKNRVYLDRFFGRDVKELERRLASVNEKIKDGYGQVNRKAGMEIAFLQEKLEDFQEKLACHEENSSRCEELVVTVDTQKDAALQYTLKTVAKNFREILKTIVHPGRGFVKWIYGDNDEMGLENDAQEPDVRRLRGVSIDVSFDNLERKDLKSLSGGQQSVVSLALVFAILQIDRSPFYLFDEADMALDCNYRSKMAALMERFSRRSQFIVSTFNPELLEYANGLIGVTYDQKGQTSRTIDVTKEDAVQFLDSSQKSESASSSNAS